MVSIKKDRNIKKNQSEIKNAITLQARRDWHKIFKVKTSMDYNQDYSNH